MTREVVYLYTDNFIYTPAGEHLRVQYNNEPIPGKVYRGIKETVRDAFGGVNISYRVVLNEIDNGEPFGLYIPKLKGINSHWAYRFKELTVEDILYSGLADESLEDIKRWAMCNHSDITHITEHRDEVIDLDDEDEEEDDEDDVFVITTDDYRRMIEETMKEMEKEQAKHFDEDKLRIDLIPSECIEEIAKVLTFGAKKYGDENWQKGMPWRKLLGSSLRHTHAWARGEDLDPESDINHLAHAACNLIFLIYYQKYGIGVDDRYIQGDEEG